MEYNIKNDAYIDICNNFKKRIIKILYLKDDLRDGKITEYDLESYIKVLNSDFYGAYIIFQNTKFINCMVELQGIKQNFNEDFCRKKILDLANFVANLPL